MDSILPLKLPWKHRPQKIEHAPESCTIVSDPIDAMLDIVFVHGFGGHCTDTWTSEGVCWPRDFLKPKLERARIISFGYDADISLFFSQDNDSVAPSPCASALLTNLTELRAERQFRPLIFVVHSIGSTVVKSALSHSSSQQTGLENVAEACRGVVFLGAAHTENSHESLGRTAAKAAAAVQPSLGNEILGKLEGQSSAFYAINESFLKYLEKRGTNFKSITFYEKSVVSAKGEITVERESARMANRDHDLLGLNTDHCNMSKFVQIEDPNYLAISNAINHFYEDIVKPRPPDCQVVYDCPKALLDIIFVHSLGCNSTESWSHGDVYWPKELLPVDMPYARVIACHYQTDYGAFMKPNQTMMRDLATQLLLSLLRVRSNLLAHASVEIRPLLFVAHSIGGTLIKQALNISHLSEGQAAMHAISIATQGIIFLGTPHRSDGRSSLGEIVAMAVHAGSPDLDIKILEVIKQDLVFELFNTTFQDYLEKREPPVHVVSFYEKRDLFRPIVTKICASLPTQRHLATLQGSHATLGQLRTQDDYKCIIKQIQAIAGQRATGKGCNVVCDPPEAKIDIIFVPDLRKGVLSAWTYEGLCWPRDILGPELPEARIILYGYNEDSSEFFSLKNQNSIFCCARNMLSDLSGIFAGDMQNRRILFIAQSTGGLLVKNAIAQSQDGHDLGAVAACLRGIIFLGSPQGWDGSDSGAISRLFKKLGIIGRPLPKQPDLKHSRQILQSVTSSFSEFVRTKGTDILCLFIEEEPFPSIGLVVEEFTAESDDSRYQSRITPATDHNDMAKVSWRPLLEAIKRVYDHALNDSQSKLSPKAVDQVLDRLSSSYGLQQILPPSDEGWKLDEKFFKDLAAWGNRHPDSTFLNVLEKIRDATIASKPLMELIPDEPFPARALVLALAHFLYLGITVAPVKREVFKFVDALSSWVVNIETNFKDGRGKFSSRARKNLVYIRNLVNEILIWGWARLHDGRWETLIHGMATVDEIRDFNQRLSLAREILSVIQDINTVMELDEVMVQIREIKKLRKSQSGEILDQLKRSQLKNERQSFLERTLHRYALRDTGVFPSPETRVEVPVAIKEWVDDLSDEGQNFFWLTGDPGSGKSAITASFAQECKDTGVLWALFFICRNTESANPRSYFPTIACQMAEHFADPTVTVVIHEILRKKESLLDEISLAQGLEFFVKIVQAACDLDRNKPVAIILDGLDETTRDRLEDTANIFSGLFKKLERCNAKVFISSRTDDEITRPFYSSLQTDSKHVKHLHLGTFGSKNGVELYLRQNLEHLVERWGLDWEQWPGEEQFEKLCEQAGGLFIWAVTVIKFFQRQLEKHGRERRNLILNVFNEKGMGDLNNLYGIILKMTMELDDEDDWEYERFRWIVGFIIGLKEPLTIGDLSGLLDLRETPDSDPVDIIHFVTNLRTVLVAGTENISNDTIPRLHKSFVEYITSHRIDPRCQVDIPVVNGQIASKCLRLVSRSRNGRERGLIPAGSVRYAIQNWMRHLPGDGNLESGVGVIGDAEGLEKILSTAAGLRKRSMSASGDYRTHMYDPKFGFPPPKYSHNTSTIRGSQPINAIAISLDGKLIASGDQGGVVQIWDSRSHEPIGNAGKHNERVTSISFSPDSRRLVSGSFDKTVRMWDCGTGQAIGSPLSGHNDWVNSVCTDGRRIISGSFDGTIRIWSCDTRQLIGTPIDVGKSIFAVTLSNGLIAVGVGEDVHIFDIETRQRISSMKGHTDNVRTVALSPNGRRVASGSGDHTIRIWDVQTGGQTHRLDGHTGAVLSVSFSADGHWIASCGGDKTVRVWNSQSGLSIDGPLTGHTSSVVVVSISPDLHLISGGNDGTIRIWSVRGKWQKPSQQITAMHLSQRPAFPSNDRISLEGHPHVISTCCSLDGSLYAASTLEGHISIWDLDRKLLWETNASVHPIHFLRLSETQLILSAPDGSSLVWHLSNGRPTHDTAVIRSPQLKPSDLRQSTSLSNDTVSWLPFDLDAGLWAYVDGDLIRFEDKEQSVTIIDFNG